MKNLIEYLESSKIPYAPVSESVVLINGEEYILILPNESGVLFDDKFELIIDGSADGEKYVFCFGGEWYWEDSKSIKSPRLNELKYIGHTAAEVTTSVFLGVRGEREPLNGSRLYREWCRKAKFLGCTSLGICEKNTLAGVLKFQLECQKNGIKSVIGATYTVLREKLDFKYDVKVYVKNEQGWENLLLINKEVKVVNKNFIKEERLLELLEGLFLVLDPKSLNHDKLTKELIRHSDFYQLDTVEYSNDSTDKTYLENLKKYVRHTSLIPISITDAFYLDRQDAKIKRILNSISGVREYESENQYFKDKSDYFDELNVLFPEDTDEVIDQFQKAFMNEIRVAQECNYKIVVGEKFLPKYFMTEDEKKRYDTNNDLFYGLIQKGLESKVDKKDHPQYLSRIAYETDVIERGEFVDYFLILWDIIKWCDGQKILVGIGRGSAAGCLISYLLNITRVDPLPYNLLFERFLNEGRIGKSIPDIDSDFPASRREEVKTYMEERYGREQVCSVGTFTTLQMKAVIRDLARVMSSISPHEMNLLTSQIDFFRGKGFFVDLFKVASKDSRLKSFIQSEPEIVNAVKLCLELPKSESVHPCATLILPSEKTIFEWLPIKKVLKDSQEIYVTEWEGEVLEPAGFLKEDILGIKQLDKFQDILSLIEQNTGKRVDIYSLPLDSVRVYNFFKKGWNADVFHFGSPGLTGYCRDLQPDNIEDLVAAISLYRPGGMELGFHTDYVQCKNGEKDVDYLWGTKEITKDTYGILIYQEQVMQICREVAGFSLVEADEIRKALGKTLIHKIKEYRAKFVEGAVKNGCLEKVADDLWSKLEKFAKYMFNRCISGSEIIYRQGHKKNSFHPTVEQMYRIKNDIEYAKSTGKLALYGKFRKIGYGTSISLNEEGRLVKNKIKDIRYEGEREVYELKLKNGSVIRVTDNHKFPTSNGEKMLSDIDVKSDLIFYKKGYEKGDTDYRFTTKARPNDERYHSRDSITEFSLNSEKGKEGWQKRDTVYTQLKYYKRNLKKSYCEVCSKTDCRLEVHHKNKDNSISDPENLQTLCCSCHKKEHYRLGRVKVGEKGLLTELVEIESIILIGVESVYDVEMENPYHTFTLESGIVTCNSHALAYSVTGYISQWLKVNYPTEYWTVAFKYALDTDYSNYISEINETGDITICSVDINNSRNDIYTDFKSNTIYWSLISIKQCGDKASVQIIEDRDKGGRYFSFDEFIDRSNFKGSKVTKQVIENLIYAGAFDQLESLKSPHERLRLIEVYRKKKKVKIDGERDLVTLSGKLVVNDWWWTLQQKRLSGIAFFNYPELLDQYVVNGSYIRSEEFQKEYLATSHKKVKLGGYIFEVEERQSKKGKWCKIRLESNYVFTDVVIWADEYRDISKMNLIEKKDCLMLMSGQVNYDKFRKENVLASYSDTEIIILE